VQNQQGFDHDLPPVKLAEKERDVLINEFEQLERVS